MLRCLPGKQTRSIYSSLKQLLSFKDGFHVFLGGKQSANTFFQERLPCLLGKQTRSKFFLQAQLPCHSFFKECRHDLLERKQEASSLLDCCYVFLGNQTTRIFFPWKWPYTYQESKQGANSFLCEWPYAFQKSNRGTNSFLYAWPYVFQEIKQESQKLFPFVKLTEKKGRVFGHLRSAFLITQFICQITKW